MNTASFLMSLPVCSGIAAYLAAHSTYPFTVSFVTFVPFSVRPSATSAVYIKAIFVCVAGGYDLSVISNPKTLRYEMKCLVLESLRSSCLRLEMVPFPYLSIIERSLLE